MNKTQSSRTSNGGRKSNNNLTTYLIQPKVSQRKIVNNIKEKLFQAKIHTYKAKQKILLDNIKEIITVHKKCIQMSKQISQPKRKYFEDVELVVARIVDEAFGMPPRAQATDDDAADEETVERRRDAKGSTAIRMSDIRVWDRQSPDDGALNSIAGRLLAHHRRLRAETARLAADRERLRRSIVPGGGPPVDEPAAATATVSHKRQLIDIMTLVRDALSSSSSSAANGSGGGHSCCARRLQHGGTAAHELRKRLALVTDKLKAAEKDRRDLLGVVERSRSDPTPIESLRAVLGKEREKNDHLQSVVDVMFTAAIHDRDAMTS